MRKIESTDKTFIQNYSIRRIEIDNHTTKSTIVYRRLDVYFNEKEIQVNVVRYRYLTDYEKIFQTKRRLRNYLEKYETQEKIWSLDILSRLSYLTKANGNAVI